MQELSASVSTSMRSGRSPRLIAAFFEVRSALRFGRLRLMQRSALLEMVHVLLWLQLGGHHP
jgi:hypothetical protein